MKLPRRIARLEQRREAEVPPQPRPDLDHISIADLRFMETAMTKMIGASGRDFGWSRDEMTNVLGKIDGSRLNDLIAAAWS